MNFQMKNPETVYIERYETFRHLDKLRWQMLQIAILVGSIVLTFGQTAATEQIWLAWAVSGFAFSMLGTAMLRITRGINKNSDILSIAGHEIGDEYIPKSPAKLFSISFLIATSLCIIGIFLLGNSFYLWYFH